MLNPFYKEGPTATQMYPCPACHEIIAARASSCRYCGIAIDDATSQRLLVESQKVTDAVARANTFKLSVWAAGIGVGLGLWLVLTSGHVDPRFVLVAVAAVGAIAYAARWFGQYGSLQTRDADYPTARQAMKRTLMVWIAALIVEGVVVLYALLTGRLQR
jgi:hypothetical protein